MKPGGFLALEVSTTLNCEAAFRFPGNFSVDFKRKREFISEIEKICIRELGEKKDTNLFPQVPLIAFPCWRECEN